MVRRAAAHKLGDFAQVVETSFVASELLQTFQGLTRDGKNMCLPQSCPFDTELTYFLALWDLGDCAVLELVSGSAMSLPVASYTLCTTILLEKRAIIGHMSITAVHFQNSGPLDDMAICRLKFLKLNAIQAFSFCQHLQNVFLSWQSAWDLRVCRTRLCAIAGCKWMWPTGSPSAQRYHNWQHRPTSQAILCRKHPYPVAGLPSLSSLQNSCKSLHNLDSVGCEDAMDYVCFLQDKSWRVRFKVAQQLFQLCEILGPAAARWASQTFYVQRVFWSFHPWSSSEWATCQKPSSTSSDFRLVQSHLFRISGNCHAVDHILVLTFSWWLQELNLLVFDLQKRSGPSIYKAHEGCWSRGPYCCSKQGCCPL